MLGIVLVASIIDLAFVLWSDIVDKSVPIFQRSELIDLFSLFLLVLIGLEFFETVVVYMNDNQIRAEIIIMVAIIAASRKIILLEDEGSDLHLIGLGVLMLSLGVAYYLVKRINLDSTRLGEK